MRLEDLAELDLEAFQHHVESLLSIASPEVLQIARENPVFYIRALKDGWIEVYLLDGEREVQVGTVHASAISYIPQWKAEMN
jgi:hypothetical protein